MDAKKEEPVFDLLKYLDQRVHVRFQGGREVDGLLKGYDKLDNLVLDECVEYLRGAQGLLGRNLPFRRRQR